MKENPIAYIMAEKCFKDGNNLYTIPLFQILSKLL